MILRMLTTNPARRFSDGETGVGRAGAPGNIVIYEQDPAASAANFSRVYYTTHGGKFFYKASSEHAIGE